MSRISLGLTVACVLAAACSGSDKQATLPSQTVAQDDSASTAADAPADAVALDQSGNEVSLASFWQESSLYLVFYRGSW